MENKKRLNYERIAKIVGIIIGVILVFGISYAVFKTVTRSEETNTISAGKLDVQIENEQEEILLENSYPITEEEGLKQAPYTFDIVNKGSINAEYDLYIEIEENTTLPTEVVRYYLTVEEEGIEKIVTEKSRIITQEETTEREGKTLYKIDTKYLDTTKTNKYKLYLWIDYEATKEEASNKYFEAKVVVDSVQIYDKNRLVKQIDVSASGDGSVLAYMYADGTVYLKGKGTIATNLSDTLVYEKEGIVDNYKKVLIQMGCNAEEVNAITSMEEFGVYIDAQSSTNENFSDEFNAALTLTLAKETLEEMGHDTSSITDMDSLITYLKEIGYMDENGEATELGNEFFTKFDEKYNNDYSDEPTPATKIVLEDGIENIPSSLFAYNESITEVRIPASVVSIDDNAFAGCTGLKEIIIPDSVTSIGSTAFYNCTSLTNVKLSNSITSIGISAFYNCISLTNVKLSNSITSIGSYAFQNCTSLISVNIPASVKSIADRTFYGCTGLKEIVIPNSVTRIGDSAFYNCTRLISIEIPTSVTYIGSSAFENCIGIKKLTIDGTKKYRILDIPNIEELIITGTGNMYDYSYPSIPWISSNDSIKSVTLSESLTSIGTYAFRGCSSLTEIEIPNNVTSIGPSAFFECTSLKSVVIPNNVTSIASSAFSNCTSLTEIRVDENNKNYTSVDGTLFNTGQTELIQYPIGKKDTNYTIPASVVSIGGSAFRGCSSLTEIEIPNSVTSMGPAPFSGCTGIKKLTIDGTKNYGSLGIPNLEELIITGTGEMYNYSSSDRPWISSNKSIKSVTLSNSLTRIGNYAFSDCSSLTEIEIPNVVTSIGKMSFYNCASLKSVVISANVTIIGFDAFQNCTNLTEISVEENNNNYTSVDGILFNKEKTELLEYPIGKKDTSYTIPESVTSIEGYAFYNCTNLTEITIPNSVASIGAYAFSGCTGIKKLTVDGTKNYSKFELTNVEELIITGTGNMYNFSYKYAPWYNSKSTIKKVTISKTITSIGNYAFSDCTSLTEIEIPNNITSIGDGSFYKCSSLKSVVIPTSVTSIGSSAFSGCNSLTSITIPNSVTNAGNKAFYTWTSSQTINIDNTEAYVNSNWNSNWKYGCSAQINYLRS